METEELYYQVVEWDTKDEEFREVVFLKLEEAAFSVKRRQEMDALIDARRENRPNHLYYFVCVMSAELVRAIRWKRYEEKLSEVREFFMIQYDDEFLSYCRQFVQKLLCVLDMCTFTELSDIGCVAIACIGGEIIKE